MRAWIRTSRRTGISFPLPILLAWFVLVCLLWPLAFIVGIVWTAKTPVLTRPAKALILALVLVFFVWATGSTR